MTEWYTIVVVVVQGLIHIFIALFIARKVEEQRHHLIKERFLAEKRWEEAKSLYYDVSQICVEILKCMREISNVLSIYRKFMQPLTGVYITLRVSIVNWRRESQFKDATESERLQIEHVDELLHLDCFDKLYNMLNDMSGRVAVSGSNQVSEMYNVLLKIAVSFPTHLVYEVNSIITESSEKTGSLAENSALEVFNRIFQFEKQMRKEGIEPLDTGSVVANFSEALKQMHKQMKKELSAGIELI